MHASANLDVASFAPAARSYRRARHRQTPTPTGACAHATAAGNGMACIRTSEFTYSVRTPMLRYAAPTACWLLLDCTVQAINSSLHGAWPAHSSPRIPDQVVVEPRLGAVAVEHDRVVDLGTAGGRENARCVPEVTKSVCGCVGVRVIVHGCCGEEGTVYGACWCSAAWNVVDSYICLVAVQVRAL
jgi:hypothetical protein